MSRISSRASSQTILKASIIGEQLGRRYKLIYEPLSSKQVPLNLVQIARWFETQDEPVRNSLEKAEPFTWLKHLDKGVSKSSRSSRYLSALIMEEYVQAQNLWGRMQTLSEDSHVLELESQFPISSRSQSFLPSSKLTNPGISFRPKATGTSPIDTAFRRSPESTFSSVATGSSFFGPILLSPVSSRSKEKAIENERPETSDDTSSSNDSVSSDNVPSRLLPSVPGVSLQPPSSEDVGAKRSAIPLSLGRANSTGSESSNLPVAQVENQSLLSSKSSKPRGIRTSLHVRNPGRRGSARKDSEESLRLEYSAKAM